MSRRMKLIVAASMVFGFGILLAARVCALPDCDGGTPKSDWCGTSAACDPPEQNPGTGEWYCPNETINQQFIQHECEEGSGTGSTLCDTVETTLVCTKRYPCNYSELIDPETEELVRVCGPNITGPGTDNSTTSKTDYVLCNDTSE